MTVNRAVAARSAHAKAARSSAKREGSPAMPSFSARPSKAERLREPLNAASVMSVTITAWKLPGASAPRSRRS